jgi:hypothetical protein
MEEVLRLPNITTSWEQLRFEEIIEKLNDQSISV